jgi:single-stranded-DNA-specific exonuclease
MSNWPEIKLSSPTDETHALAKVLHISPFLAQLLYNREIDAAAAREMLQTAPELLWPEAPFTKELQTLFLQLHDQKSPIAIFGDYDADGLSGSSVLMCFLKGAGFDVKTLLPTRSQGYGLNKETLGTLIKEGYPLLITVDCGISNREEIAFCREQGMDVVITDHHGLPEHLPDATFTLHPEVLKIEALKNLSGAGMAYWLTCLLAPVFPEAPAPESLLDLAVLGTLADMTPLRGLNFALAKRGLQAFKSTQRPGLIALSQLKDVTLSTLTEDDLTFRMIPLLNAAGRIDSPMPALSLLLAETAGEAAHLANTLEALNKQRQKWCQEVLASAQEKLVDHTGSCIVLADEDWPHGVLGITCSQLVSQYHQPVALMAIDGDTAKASIRAPKGYHILEALQACQHLLMRFGGHEMAGGLSLKVDNIAAFAEAFTVACDSQQTDYTHELEVDMDINPRLLSLDLWEELRTLAPFGMGNRPPLFMSMKAPIKDLKSDKKTHTHLFGQLGSQVRLKAWGAWDPAYLSHKTFDIVYRLECNTWRKQKKLELTVEHIRVSAEPQRPLKKQVPPDETVKVPAVTSAVKKTAPVVATPSTQSPHPFEVLKPVAFLPGFFYSKKDGHQEWWQIPQVTYAENQIHWHDDRQGELNPGHSVTYALNCPTNTVVRTAEPGAFSAVILPHLPLQDHQSILRTGFHDIYIAAAQEGPELPDFGLMSQVVQYLSQGALAEKGVRNALELGQDLRLNRYQAKICLRTLCDLGLLTYDRERYCLSYKNQAYNLNDSVFYQEQKADWQIRQNLYKQWHGLHFTRLKKLLTQEVSP